MDDVIAIDAAGRLVVPKWIREKFGLRGGTSLRLEVQGDALLLRPIAREPELREVDGLLVVASPVDAWPDHREDREDRLAKLAR